MRGDFQTLDAHMEHAGRWLFRWRSYLPLAPLGLVFLGLRGFTYPAGSESLGNAWCAACLLVGFVGIGIRIATVGHVPPGTSGRNTRKHQADALNTTGMYSIVRNPLYLGNYLMWMGIALMPRTIWVPLVITLAFWLYHERIIFSEEQFLRRKHGRDFEEWAARTPAFFPSFSRWVPPDYPFSVRIVLSREHAGLLALVTIIVAMMMVGDYLVQGRVVLQPAWLILLAATVFLYSAVFILKKTTRLLDGER